MACRRRGSAAAACGALWLAAALAAQVFGFVGQEVAREGRVKPTAREQREAGAAEGARQLPVAEEVRPISRPPGEKRAEVAVTPDDMKGADGGVAFASAARAAPRGARARGPRALQAAGGSEALERPELPEASRATIRAAEECLSDGCPLDAVEEIAAKLARDETRLWQQYQRSVHSGADEVDEGSWMNGVLFSVQGLREHLEDLVDQRYSGYIPFGGGQTGGFFRAPVH